MLRERKEESKKAVNAEYTKRTAIKKQNYPLSSLAKEGLSRRRFSEAARKSCTTLPL